MTLVQPPDSEQDAMTDAVLEANRKEQQENLSRTCEVSTRTHGEAYERASTLYRCPR